MSQKKPSFRCSKQLVCTAKATPRHISILLSVTLVLACCSVHIPLHSKHLLQSYYDTCNSVNVTQGEQSQAGKQLWRLFSYDADCLGELPPATQSHSSTQRVPKLYQTLLTYLKKTGKLSAQSVCQQSQQSNDHLTGLPPKAQTTDYRHICRSSDSHNRNRWQHQPSTKKGSREQC